MSCARNRTPHIETLWLSSAQTFDFALNLSSRSGILFVVTRKTLVNLYPSLGGGREQDAWICDHRRMNAGKDSKVFILQERLLVLYFWCENHDLKIPSPLLGFLSNSVPPRPSDRCLAGSQAKYISAKFLIMETNMWWENSLSMFSGKNLLMRLQKELFLLGSWNLSKIRLHSPSTGSLLFYWWKQMPRDGFQPVAF